MDFSLLLAGMIASAAAIAQQANEPAQHAAAQEIASREADRAIVGDDWITTGTDCRCFAAGDVTGDGHADILTINGNRDLCVAPSVHGWKAAGWRVLLSDFDPAAVGMAVVGGPAEKRLVVVEAQRIVIMPVATDGTLGERTIMPTQDGQAFTGMRPEYGPRIFDSNGKIFILAADGTLSPTIHPEPPDAGVSFSLGARITPPPYDPDAKSLTHGTCTIGSGIGEFGWSVFATSRPHPHHVVRCAVFDTTRAPDLNGDGSLDSEELRLGSQTIDRDGDGLSDWEESIIGTYQSERDTDGDGLLDGWEVHGLPPERVKDLGPRIGLFDAAATGAERGRRLSPLRQDVIVNISYFEQVDRAQFANEIPKVQKVYRELNIANPDGTTGLWVHVRELDAVVPAADQHLPWWDIGNKYFARSERGLMHWMQVTPWGGGQSSQTGDMGGCGNGWAVFAHEFGHQLGLSHTGDSAPGWCPLYPSLMNYAYSYSFDGDGAKPHFSSGEFRDLVLDERALSEKLPYAFDRVKFLANWPFRFTLKDNGDGTTLIDWNHNGAFDEGTVEADINYGGSTHAGERRTHTLIGSAPSLAYIGERCFLAASAHKQNAVTVKMLQGGEQWTGETIVPSSSTRFDPVLVGGADYGAMFVRQFNGWAMAAVRAGEGENTPPLVGALQPLPELPAADLSAIRIGDRLLLVTRYDSHALEARWLVMGEKPALSAAQTLAFTSMVPPGLAINPADGSITVVVSNRSEQHGPFCMQTASLSINGDAIVEAAGGAHWTNGGRVCHCTSRPAVVYRGTDEHAQLVIFHTGWTDGNGCWTGWRTMNVGNQALDGGWLTAQLYDEWTRSRVALGFADGPQGAIYAFRWDPGDHHDWKVNTMFVAHNGYGIDDQPMRDFDDGALIGQWGIRHSILTMPTDEECGIAPGLSPAE